MLITGPADKRQKLKTKIEEMLVESKNDLARFLDYRKFYPDDSRQIVWCEHYQGMKDRGDSLLISGTSYLGPPLFIKALSIEFASLSIETYATTEHELHEYFVFKAGEYQMRDSWFEDIQGEREMWYVKDGIVISEPVWVPSADNQLKPD
jgi:hypothetical protein